MPASARRAVFAAAPPGAGQWICHLRLSPHSKFILPKLGRVRAPASGGAPSQLSLIKLTTTGCRRCRELGEAQTLQLRKLAPQSGRRLGPDRRHPGWPVEAIISIKFSRNRRSSGLFSTLTSTQQQGKLRWTRNALPAASKSYRRNQRRRWPRCRRQADRSRRQSRKGRRPRADAVGHAKDAARELANKK